MDKPITRREVIARCVSSYIQNNPEEYQIFLSAMKEQRAKLVDSKFGRLNKGANTIDHDDIRRAWRIPEKLMGTIEVVFKADNTRFLEAQGEAAWFSRNFPQFLLPEKY